MHDNDYAVIIGGGTGSRLWPLSRREKPKQFHTLVGSESTLQLMYRLLGDIFPPERIFVQSPKRFGEVVLGQLPQLDSANLLLEPSSRDTAPAFGFATAKILQHHPQANIGYFYADHIINNPKEFSAAVQTAFSAVRDFPDHIVMIGVKPTFPHTGLGYIRLAAQKKVYDSGEVFSVKKFIEKPTLSEAEKLVKSWEYLWNAGYKVMNASRFFEIVAEADPEMVNNFKKIGQLMKRDDYAAIAKTYDKLPKTSFEYLVTERIKKLLVVPSDMEWQDIGDWQALYDILTERLGSSVVTRGNYIGVKTNNSLIYAQDRLVATVGVNNLIIVDAGDVVLVADKSLAQDVKPLVEKLHQENKDIYL